MSFFRHRLAPGQSHSVDADNEEVAIVLLGGKCVADWGEGQHRIGERTHVFDGLPYAILSLGGKSGSTASGNHMRVGGMSRAIDCAAETAIVISRSQCAMVMSCWCGMAATRWRLGTVTTATT
jgi:5-deoxy-D-glucuronate isomerase